MKVGHSSYGCYGDFIDFLVVSKNIYVIDHDLGYLGYATDADTVYKLVETVGDYNRDDIIDVVNIAIKNAKDEKPYNEQ